MTSLPSLPIFRLTAMLLALIFISACAPQPAIGPTATSKPTAAVKPIPKTTPALVNQLTEISQQINRQAEQIQALQQQLAQLQQQLKEQPQSNTKVAAQPEVTKPVPQPATTPAPIPMPTPAPIASLDHQEITSQSTSAAAYLAAFTDLAFGRYASAETGFQGFLNKFPEHQFSPNARFWLATAQYDQNMLPSATANLNQILSNPQEKAKAPAALLMLSQIYQQQGQDFEANKILDQLRNSYPDSPEAQHLYRSNPPQ